jgi:hypothetical protein
MMRFCICISPICGREGGGHPTRKQELLPAVDVHLTDRPRQLIPVAAVGSCRRAEGRSEAEQGAEARRRSRRGREREGADQEREKNNEEEEASMAAQIPRRPTRIRRHDPQPQPTRPLQHRRPPEGDTGTRRGRERGGPGRGADLRRATAQERGGRQPLRPSSSPPPCSSSAPSAAPLSDLIG